MTPRLEYVWEPLGPKTEAALFEDALNHCEKSMLCLVGRIKMKDRYEGPRHGWQRKTSSLSVTPSQSIGASRAVRICGGERRSARGRGSSVEPQRKTELERSKVLKDAKDSPITTIEI